MFNDRYLQVVHWPRITLPALSAYGVHSATWPPTFPRVNLVFDELYDPQSTGNFVAPCVDLETVTVNIRAEKEVERER